MVKFLPGIRENPCYHCTRVICRLRSTSASVRSRSDRLPAGPTTTIRTRFVVAVGEPPYDLRLDVIWDPALGRHTLRQLTLTEQPGSEYVWNSRINQLALSDVSELAL